MDAEPFSTRPKLCELNDRYVTIVSDPAPEFVEKVIEQFTQTPFTIYAMYDDDMMFATELTSHGLVTMYRYSSVVAPTLPNEVLNIPIGGQYRDYNHRFVLPHAAVIAPVREFLRHHHTPEVLGWERSRPDHPNDKPWPDESSLAKQSLNAADMRVLFSALDHDAELSVIRMRPHNNTILKSSESFMSRELADEIEEALLTGHLRGGDIEIPLPNGRTIQGNHEGQFWLDSAITTSD